MLLKLRRLFKTVGREGLILFYVCRSATTPPWIRLAAVAMLVYVISPIDFVSDLIPVLGWADDFALLVFGIPWVLSRVPANILASATEQATARWARFGF